ncbi:hypothetical protein UFOVP250_111 [uncultured Caudovirales phage]|uniref:Uncharacterized protein n=1 Tax=uncultured Caudovirales phage TaxID=2100421 RepID=A0A6J5LF33_9CAUD|nr:hypothetical protein UFOVP250_111 [uncultured Caudovirales phage]
MTTEQLHIELMDDNTPGWRRCEIVIQLWKKNATN